MTTRLGGGAPSRLHARAERGGASTDKARQMPEIPPSCDGHHSGASQGELIHTHNQAHLTGGLK
jgi:hypothetical protein